MPKTEKIWLTIVAICVAILILIAMSINVYAQTSNTTDGNTTNGEPQVTRTWNSTDHLIIYPTPVPTWQQSNTNSNVYYRTTAKGTEFAVTPQPNKGKKRICRGRKCKYR